MHLSCLFSYKFTKFRLKLMFCSELVLKYFSITSWTPCVKSTSRSYNYLLISFRTSLIFYFLLIVSEITYAVYLGTYFDFFQCLTRFFLREDIDLLDDLWLEVDDKQEDFGDKLFEFYVLWRNGETSCHVLPNLDFSGDYFLSKGE